MAYVAITKELINLVTAKMMHLQSAELTPLPDPLEMLTNWVNSAEAHDLMTARLWQPVLHLTEQLALYNRRDTVSLCLRINDITEINGIQRMQRYRQLDVPCIYHRKSQYDTEVTTIELAEDEHPTAAAIAEAFRNRQEVALRWNAVIKQVTDFLHACKSLNEAIKLWPDVVRYIPKQHMDRLQIKTEKVERTNNALDALRKLDLDAIQSSNVLARMAGAQV